MLSQKSSENKYVDKIIATDCDICVIIYYLYIYHVCNIYICGMLQLFAFCTYIIKVSNISKKYYYVFATAWVCVLIVWVCSF